MSVTRSPQAFTVIEVIVAIGILLFGILAAFTAITQTISAGTDSVNRTIATHLATEGLELVRNVRDTNKIAARAFNASLSTNGNYLIEYSLSVPGGGTICLIGSASCASSRPLDFNLSGTNAEYGYNGWGGFTGSPSRFTRVISITNLTDNGVNPAASYLLVKSTVTWTNRSATKQVVLQTHLYDWRP